jgi:hypothetical protein
MIRGIDVKLYVRTQIGTDEGDQPIYSEEPVTVHNVLVGQPSSEDIIDAHSLYGKTLAYTLGIPKGDAHQSEGGVVEFFGQKFRVIGPVTQGIDELIPLKWNKKVQVERYEC